MNDIKKQIEVYSKRSSIRATLRPLTFDKHARRYIFTTLKRYRKPLQTFLGIIIALSAIEVSIPLVLDRVLKSLSYQLEVTTLTIVSIFFLILIIGYLVLSYYGISLKKKISLDIVNQVREDWLSWYLSKTVSSFNDGDKGSLYVKVSYHLSLFQLGINSSFFIFLQWLIFAASILVVSAFVDTRLLLISLIFIPLNVIVFLGSYVLSSYYLAKDQTLYSKLLRYISDTFNAFPLVKALKKEEQTLRTVRHIVDIDNYFRIKREVVLQLGDKIIFALIALISAGSYLINLYTPIFSFGNEFGSLVHVLIVVLHLRLIYLSLRMGLYSYPLKLGAYLCIPPRTIKKKYQELKALETLEFKAKKVRFSEAVAYQKHVSFTFTQGNRYHIVNTHNTYPAAHLFAGIASPRYGKQWIVKVNEKHRFLYSHYLERINRTYYLNPYAFSELTFHEFLGDHTKVQSLKEYPLFSFIFDKKRFLGSNMSQNHLSFEELCLLQCAYCMIHHPEVIVIDPLVYDTNYQHIHDGIELMKQHCTKSIIITVSHHTKHPAHHVIYTL